MQASHELSTEATALQIELELSRTQYDTLLRLSKEADEAAMQAMRARDAELWIWRGTTALGLALALLAALWR
jgi:hypothetical protein